MAVTISTVQSGPNYALGRGEANISGIPVNTDMVFSHGLGVMPTDVILIPRHPNAVAARVAVDRWDEYTATLRAGLGVAGVAGTMFDVLVEVR